MSFLENQFKLKDNPFRMTPALRADEIIWAGFPELKMQLKKRIQRSMKLSNSSLVLNWGDWGSGKTHSANYFNNQEVLKTLADEIKKKPPFSIKITFPTGKKPVTDLFTIIIDHVDIEKIRDDFKDSIEEIDRYVENFSQNIFITNTIKAIFNKNADSALLKGYLYGTLSAKEFKELKELNILRRIETDDDRVKILSALFTCLTFEQRLYSNVIIWLDEFESISLLNNVNIENLNNFIRELLDNTPNHLLLFLNFTLTALLDVEDLGNYLSNAVISRIRDRIHFKGPDAKELKCYLNDLLNHSLYRIASTDNVFHPFTEGAIDSVIELLDELSLRRYNEAFSILLELAELEEKPLIDAEFVIKPDNKDEIVGWK